MGRPRSKDITKEQILQAMEHTRSNKAAARWLGASYDRYKYFAKQYDATKPGFENLFEQHKNSTGKGIAHRPPRYRKEDFTREKLIYGDIPFTKYNTEFIKRRLFEEGLLPEKCHVCSFNEQRVLDYKIPLLLNFKDGDKKNYRADNLEVLCYNHYFLLVGDIFSKYQISQIEKYEETSSLDLKDKEWNLDPKDIESFEKLGLIEKKDEEQKQLDKGKFGDFNLIDYNI